MGFQQEGLLPEGVVHPAAAQFLDVHADADVVYGDLFAHLEYYF